MALNKSCWNEQAWLSYIWNVTQNYTTHHSTITVAFVEGRVMALKRESGLFEGAVLQQTSVAEETSEEQ